MSNLPLLELDAGDRVLCVVAHPDDLEYGASSAVARWTAQGIHTTYLLLTSGEAGIDGTEPADTARIRASEQQQACAQVGVGDLRILGFPDGVLEYSLEMRESIAGVIRSVRPTVVVTMDWSEGMPWGLNQADHRVAGLATLDAVRDAGNRWVFPDLADDRGNTLDRWQASHLLVFGSGSPTHAVDVTGEPVEKGHLLPGTAP